jgi:hypothetical protein
MKQTWVSKAKLVEESTLWTSRWRVQRKSKSSNNEFDSFEHIPNALLSRIGCSVVRS